MSGGLRKVVAFGWQAHGTQGFHTFLAWLSPVEWRIVEANVAWLEEQARDGWGVELPSVTLVYDGECGPECCPGALADIGSVLAEIATQSRYEEGAYVKRNLAFDAALGRISGLAGAITGKVQS